MKRIKKKIHFFFNTILHKIWFGKHYGNVFSLLQLLSLIYYFILKLKKQGKKSLLKPFVICVGNITVGGTGKTPCIIALYRALESSGYNIALMTRGYVPYGKKITDVIKINQGEQHNYDVNIVGDEALLLSSVATTYISSDRLKAAEIAANDGFDIILMDDGLQNTKLESDYTFCVFDSEYGIGNGYLLPAGPLREKFDDRVVDSIIIVMRSNTIQSKLQKLLKNISADKIFESSIEVKNPELFINKEYICLAGIGHPEKFFDSAKHIGINVLKTFAFPDHYQYSDDDLLEIYNYGCRVLTTAKDFKRIPEKFHQMTDVLEIELHFNSEIIVQDILQRVKEKKERQ
jgi:tetraacyldisaccharide 4'-kinase